MQTTAKATTHRVPDIIKNRVALIMEHRCHFLPLRGHQHGRNIDGPTVRHQKDNFLVITPHLFDDLQPLPVNARLNFLRSAYCQLSHHCHRLRRGGKHLINNRFAFSFTTFWKAERQID
ncbi:Uncharacterised protein [Shigella sonnei]|nr:Uncharacterised protein [Shigella sonnei]CSP96964.1 Uncharacterised protein [Shigella sonnei]CSQ80171.1 Uncharacterised protein [Shigella sonnei]